MTDPVNGAAAAEEELVDYEEEEVPEGDAAKGDQVRITAARTPMAARSIYVLPSHARCVPTCKFIKLSSNSRIIISTTAG